MGFYDEIINGNSKYFTYDGTGWLTVHANCPKCNNKVELSYNINSYTEKEIELKVEKIRIDPPICYRCKYKAAWDIILGIYSNAYSKDTYKTTVINSIAKIVFTGDSIEPKPTKFKTMLEDRGLAVGNIERNLWNIAVDECSLYKDGNVYQINRWCESDTVNKIFNFFK